jgi:hypothetical protein
MAAKGNVLQWMQAERMQLDVEHLQQVQQLSGGWTLGGRAAGEVLSRQYKA